VKKINFEKITKVYDGLSDSDKRAVLILAFFFAVISMYLLLDKSFQYRKAQVNDFKKNKSLMELLVSSEQKIKSLKQDKKLEGQDQALLTLVSSTANNYQITFKRFQPEGDTVLKLWMEHINFNNLLRWLNDINNRNGISVNEISVEQSKEEGYVDVRLTLMRL